MTDCLHPVPCWICGECVSKDGVLSPNLVFSERQAYRYFQSVHRDALLRPEFGLDRLVCEDMRRHLVYQPCGKCATCQIRKRKDMSVRLVHEASQYEKSCFITLTYNEDSVPMTQDGAKTLLPSDVQKFIKRLRRHLEYIPKRKFNLVRDHVEKIRYFAVGEYGGKTHRPHYHIIIFGWSPSDAEIFKMHNGKPVFRSKQIEKLWQFGYSTFSEVTPYVAKYCARYVTKKFARLEAADPRDKLVVPEFVLQSTRDGAIGAKWFDKYGADSCQVGLCTIRVGRKIQKCSIPKYYWQRLRRSNLPVWLKCRDMKIAYLVAHPDVEIDLEAILRKVDFARYQHKQELDKEFF